MRQYGFTFTELLVAMVLVMLIATLAMPAFGDMIEAQRRRDAALQLASGLRAARVEAITRHQVVLLQAIDDDWSKGWRMTLNPSGQGAGDEANVLLTERAFSGKIPITARLRDRPYVVFNRLGAPANSNGTLFICERNQAVSHYRVIIAVTGRVLVEAGREAEPYCER